MSRTLVCVIAMVALTAAFSPAALVGDDHPPLANYTINNVPPNYHGAWLNIDSWNGKGMVVVHWKES